MIVHSLYFLRVFKLFPCGKKRMKIFVSIKVAYEQKDVLHLKLFEPSLSAKYQVSMPGIHVFKRFF